MIASIFGSILSFSFVWLIHTELMLNSGKGKRKGESCRENVILLFKHLKLLQKYVAQPVNKESVWFSPRKSKHIIRFIRNWRIISCTFCWSNLQMGVKGEMRDDNCKWVCTIYNSSSYSKAGFSLFLIITLSYTATTSAASWINGCNKFPVFPAFWNA